MSELDGLIAEQRKDARVGHRVFGISLDAYPNILRRRRQVASDPRHGTLNCYTNLRCRCAKCRAVSATAKREQRRRSRVDKGAYRYRTCCADCGSTNVKRERVYGEAG